MIVDKYNDLPARDKVVVLRGRKLKALVAFKDFAMHEICNITDSEINSGIEFIVHYVHMGVLRHLNVFLLFYLISGRIVDFVRTPILCNYIPCIRHTRRASAGARFNQNGMKFPFNEALSQYLTRTLIASRKPSWLIYYNALSRRSKNDNMTPGYP